jgi:hypothetical protein
MKPEIRESVLKRMLSMRRALKFSPFISGLTPFLAAIWPLFRYRMSYILPCKYDLPRCEEIYVTHLSFVCVVCES